MTKPDARTRLLRPPRTAPAARPWASMRVGGKCAGQLETLARNLAS